VREQVSHRYKTTGKFWIF